MVNAKNLLTAGVVVLTLAGIMTYMNANKLTTEDISVVQACYEAHGKENPTCISMDEKKWTWDTVIPCLKYFKEETYFYTPRMMFVYMNPEDGGELGRTTKGEKKFAYTAAMNLTFIEALDQRCGPMKDDADLDTFMEAMATFQKGDRELALYGVHQVTTLLGSAVLGLVGMHHQWNVDIQQYRSCSNGLAIQFVTGDEGLIDTAECGCKSSPSRSRAGSCHRRHGRPSGNDWRSGWHCGSSQRGSRDQLNKGCVVHDQCLIGNTNYDKNGKSVDTNGGGAACDAGLASAAWTCLQFNALPIRCTGCSGCSWRGCSGCSGCGFQRWGWRHSTNEDRWSAALVWATMGLVKPNKKA